ncbi:hypothetical protein DM860_017927 [Cuscuta australis]|uniref:Uncharacterized protein n=1 Tax=Cuscuta australis TaxID=267555 RepID=A0A328DZJ6_9ASTE|nr:hypothetical protein DM860_017927 [Cuscuta australis]
MTKLKSEEIRLEESRDPVYDDYGTALKSQPPRLTRKKLRGVWDPVGGEPKQQRGESQRIVAARPLYRLQYLVAYLSRLQKILLAARSKLNLKASTRTITSRQISLRHVPLGTKAPTTGQKTSSKSKRLSSTDSNLEAFSHNPAHGSFAALAFQPNTMTNCANQRFLLYWVELLSQHKH